VADISDKYEVVVEELLDVAIKSLNDDRNPDDLLRIAALITAGRRIGAIPLGPPPQALALALVGVVKGVRIHLAGEAPFDILLAERAACGVLGLAPTPGAAGTK
jgi:hypothetical protein